MTYCGGLQSFLVLLGLPWVLWRSSMCPSYYYSGLHDTARSFMEVFHGTYVVLLAPPWYYQVLHSTTRIYIAQLGLPIVSLGPLQRCSMVLLEPSWYHQVCLLHESCMMLIGTTTWVLHGITMYYKDFHGTTRYYQDRHVTTRCLMSASASTQSSNSIVKQY